MHSHCIDAADDESVQPIKISACTKVNLYLFLRKVSTGNAFVTLGAEKYENNSVQVLTLRHDDTEDACPSLLKA